MSGLRMECPSDGASGASERRPPGDLLRLILMGVLLYALLRAFL
jgi:hypothetical protein